MDYEVATALDEPAVAQWTRDLIGEAWPRFMVAATAPPGRPAPDWMGVLERWPALQFVLRAPATGRPVAAGNMVPLALPPDQELPDEGWDWAMLKAVADLEAGVPPTTACAVSATIAPTHQGMGLSRTVLEHMRRIGAGMGLSRLIAPVRPNWKARHPTVAMEDYLRWTRQDGHPYDPWLRTHVRLGGRILQPCARSMTLWADLHRWSEWTGAPLVGTGEHLVPGLLAPLRVDARAQTATYVEPNVWVVHELRD